VQRRLSIVVRRSVDAAGVDHQDAGRGDDAEYTAVAAQHDGYIADAGEANCNRRVRRQDVMAAKDIL
jgi:hypothetical protein